MRPEIFCVGEAIIDFIATAPGVSLQEAGEFVKVPGGAAANVATGLARLGTRAGFAGTVGDDAFGRFLVQRLREAGVDVSGVQWSTSRKTRLAFVALAASGEREFEFWEQSPADELPVRLPEKLLRGARCVHISSFMLLKKPARLSVLHLAAIARRKGCTVSFDPNLRLALWKSRREAREVMRKMIGLSTLLRMNREEAQFLTGQAEPAHAARTLLRQGPRLVVITDGEHGSSAYSAISAATVPGFAVTAVDTTGCGDAFLAGLLHEVLRLNIDPGRWSQETLIAVCRYANAAGALNSLKHGASTAMPTGDAVSQFLASRKDD